MENEKAEDGRAGSKEGSPPSADNEKTDASPGATTNGQQQGKPSRLSPDEAAQQSKGPAGGFDNTPIPSRSPGYTIKFTFYRAHNLPMADINALSSDPYLIAQLDTDTPTRHKEDPSMRFRTPTVRKSIDPEWNQSWVVANVPTSGFKLKLRIYDEDPNDTDDRLGNVHINVPHIDPSWQGLSEQGYGVKKRSGSKRAYLVQAIATCFNKDKHMSGEVFVGIENLGRTSEDGQNGRLYTVGPSWSTRHYSPLLGRLANRKAPDADDQPAGSSGEQRTDRKVERFNFQANQMQLHGPVPPQLYHRFVEFKPWVKRMFTSSGLQGAVLGKALHHQHNRVYHFDRGTLWGHFDRSPSTEVTKRFLDLVHHDRGGRIFTYVLTLDSLFRFTETGKEFGIDMLSKHTMHSDVSIYIAFSGEFFIRRLKHSHRPPPPDPVDETSHDHPPAHSDNPTHPASELPGGPPDSDTVKDPAHYELIIDNDSGTYRPNAKLLPQLRHYLSHALPGLHIQTLDCQADAEKMGKWKQEQRDRKKAEGERIIYRQGSMSSSASSISSSDVDDLDAREAGFADGNGSVEGDRGPTKTAARDAKLKQQARWAKAKRNYGGAGRSGGAEEEMSSAEVGSHAKDDGAAAAGGSSA